MREVGDLGMVFREPGDDGVFGNVPVAWSDLMPVRSSSPLSLGVVAAGLLLTAGGAAASSLTNAALFDANASGGNASGGGGSVTNGAWTTVLDYQNAPGNYAAELFLARIANPVSADFISPSAALNAALSEGANTFYFWADGDDPAGGTAGFGLNLFLDGATTTAPSISAFATVGGAPVTDNAGCTSGYFLNCVTGAGTFTYVTGLTTITLTNYVVLGRGGGAGGEDRVASTNTAPFAFPTGPNGVNDTYGSFTLTVRTAEPTGGVPEPASWALMIAGFGLAGASLRRRRGVAAA